MRTALNSCLGIAACAGVAGILTLFLADSTDARLAVPAICLQVVIAARLYGGRMAALIGALASSLIFELVLFPPLGSFVVPDPTERTVLILFQVISMGVVLMSPRSSSAAPSLGTGPRFKPSGPSIRQLIRQRHSR